MSRRPRKRHVQLTLDQARKPDGRHGGWRPHAGRKPKAGSISHATRPAEPARFPQHVTLRIAEGAPSLAREGLMKIVRAAIRDSQRGAPQATQGRRAHRAAAADHNVTRELTRRGVSADHGETSELASRGGFRVVEFNVLGNHLHLIVEAASKDALASGVAGLEIRVARRVNAALGRRGKLFPQRYHARALRTPREVRNALRYVLLNRKHHTAAQRFGRFWIDACSSAPWFTGWAQPIRGDEPWKRELLALPPPTAPPETWLLATGWKRHGLLRFDERPG